VNSHPGLLKRERNVRQTIVLDLLHWTGKCDKWQKIDNSHDNFFTKADSKSGM